MRANMDPLNPMASTLDPAIAQIYSQASSIREASRQSAPRPQKSRAVGENWASEKRAGQLVNEVLEAPARVRALMEEGKAEEAEEAWRLPKRLLLKWKERGIGGDDIDACLAEGEAGLFGEAVPGR